MVHISSLSNPDLLTLTSNEDHAKTVRQDLHDDRFRPHSSLSTTTRSGCCRSFMAFSNSQRDVPISARQARILAPLGLAFGSLLSPFSTQAVEPPSATAAPPTFSSSSTITTTTTTTAAFLPSVQRYFPQSLPTSTVRRLVRQALLRRHYNPTNTLLATSVCPDEINSKPHVSLSSALQEDLLGDDSTAGIFALGGLAGLPFAGISGLQALFSHVPRNVVILLAPHIGIAQNGRVGMVERSGTTPNGGIATHLSTACGAAIGAGRKLVQQCQVDNIMAGGHPCLPAAPSRLSFLDYEEDYILDQLRPSIESMLSSPDLPSEDERNARITTAIYTMSLNMFMKELEVLWQQGGCPDHVEEITLLSGIIVNQGEVVNESDRHGYPRRNHHHHHADDYFQPRLFQTWTKPKEGWTISSGDDQSTSVQPPVVDLLPSTFGNSK